jgi:hypothetical protein
MPNPEISVPEISPEVWRELEPRLRELVKLCAESIALTGVLPSDIDLLVTGVLKTPGLPGELTTLSRGEAFAAVMKIAKERIVSRYPNG